MSRLKNEVFWIFSEGGIEDKIYKSVINKKDYTLSQFYQDARKSDTIKDHQTV